MKILYYWRLISVVCLIGLCFGCDDDIDRGYAISGRWFGDLGMMINGEPAVGSVIEFVPDRYDYTAGYGYETDYFEDRFGLYTVDHEFDWMIRDGVIYLRFDDPGLDCNIRDYVLSDDFFSGYMDGVYSSTYFSLRNYRYWNEYGYWNYRSKGLTKEGAVEKGRTVPVCIRKQNIQKGEGTK